VHGGITEALERRVERKRCDDMNCGGALAPANALRGCWYATRSSARRKPAERIEEIEVAEEKKKNPGGHET